MKPIGAALALTLSLLLAPPGHAQQRVATAADTLPAALLQEAAPDPAPPATVAAPADMTTPSTATPATLSAPSVSTTPDPAPAPPALAIPAIAPPAVGNAPPAPSPMPTVQSALTPLEVAPKPAAPMVEARINLSRQRMEVWVDGVQRHSWPVSTARKGYRTPLGTYQPGRMHKRYFSRKYDNAPMPYAIFFHKGWAIHGTNDLRRLGRPASHGCVRLHPNNARALFAIVSEHGRANTRIMVTR